jgi:hypothetical protein
MYKEYLQKLEDLKGVKRIELGLDDDVNKARKNLEQVIKDSEHPIKESKRILGDLGGIAGVVATMKIAERTVNKRVTDLGDITIKMEKALKDLGVNPASQKPIIDADRTFSEGLQVRKELTGAIEKIVSKAKQIK